MGIGRYLHRHIAAPIVQRLGIQSHVLFDMYVADLLSRPPYNAAKRLEPHGFRSFSQNDEDGILQEIFRRIGVSAGTFVEFGVATGIETNTRLLLYRGWKGLWIEADPGACAAIRRHFAAELSSGQLQLRGNRVTRENISELIDSARLGELDLLSIDIDGNDYWIWEAIQARPRVVVIEYNAKFRPPTRWIMEYNESHRWNGSDYHGASLQSLSDLAQRKGYTLVGCCLAGVNVFFVRDDCRNDQFADADVGMLYNPARYHIQALLPAGHPPGTFGPYHLR